MSKMPAKKELQPFDICILYEGKKQPKIHMDQDLMQIISTLVAQHGKLLIKVNWFNDGLLAITPNDKDSKEPLTTEAA